MPICNSNNTITSNFFTNFFFFYDISLNKTKNCIQKVGIYRYNAYKDTGSDLSFTVCLLDEKNNGIVFNGIYSRDMSNIYAKPIENGMSKYKVTPEEQEAINRAMVNI